MSCYTITSARSSERFTLSLGTHTEVPGILSLCSLHTQPLPHPNPDNHDRGRSRAGQRVPGFTRHATGATRHAVGHFETVLSIMTARVPSPSRDTCVAGRDHGHTSVWKECSSVLFAKLFAKVQQLPLTCTCDPSTSILNSEPHVYIHLSAVAIWLYVPCCQQPMLLITAQGHGSLLGLPWIPHLVSSHSGFHTSSVPTARPLHPGTTTTSSLSCMRRSLRQRDEVQEVHGCSC